jgi:processive 1,2-diacylglycerol beta-glucosyltransferase
MKTMKRDKILILFGNYGDGHRQAAYAIRKAMRMHLPHVESVVLDFMKWTHPYLHSIAHYVFMQGVKKFPYVYGYFYEKTREGNPYPRVLKTFNIFGLNRIVKLIHKVQPTIVISTFPLAAAAMSQLKSLGLTECKTVTVITDHTDHRSWIHSNTDQYIVGSNPVRMALRELGIADTQIAVTGIPVRPEFTKSYKREHLLAKHGLQDNVPTVLLMGGGAGIIGEGKATFKALEALPEPVQFIIVCGHNQKLKQRLEEKFKNSKHHVILTGYVTHIHEFMAIADIMITKSGGVTTSEAIAMELPMLLYKSLPGQEEENAKFLVEAGVAMQAENPLDLVRKLEFLLQNPNWLSCMKDRSRQFHTKLAAFHVLDIIFQTKEEVRI